MSALSELCQSFVRDSDPHERPVFIDLSEMSEMSEILAGGWGWGARPGNNCRLRIADWVARATRPSSHATRGRLPPRHSMFSVRLPRKNAKNAKEGELSVYSFVLFAFLCCKSPSAVNSASRFDVQRSGSVWFPRPIGWGEGQGEGAPGIAECRLRIADWGDRGRLARRFTRLAGNSCPLGGSMFSVRCSMLTPRAEQLTTNTVRRLRLMRAKRRLPNQISLP